MRNIHKKASLVVVGTALAIGAALTVVAPASAEDAPAPSYYSTQGSCLAALSQTGRSDLVCNKTIGKPWYQAWILSTPAG